MAKNGHAGPSKNGIWTYAYKIVPPQAEEGLGAIKALLEREHEDAKVGARKWAGRVVLEEQVTHILVVSDNPEQDSDVNRRLEAGLKRLKVGFSKSAALAVESDGDMPAGDPATNGK